MLVHCENDNDVPIAEAEQFYVALPVGSRLLLLRIKRHLHPSRHR